MQYLPIVHPVIQPWLKSIDKTVNYYEPKLGYHLVRVVDFFWVQSFPLPFGPFQFLRHWYENCMWWMVLKDFHGVIFLVEIYKLFSWFSSLSDDFIYLCQRYGKPCKLFRSIAWEPEVLNSEEKQVAPTSCEG